MYNRVILFFSFVFASVIVGAEVQPKEHAYLNYTTVYFEEAPIPSSKKSTLVVFVDSLYPNQSPLFQIDNAIPAYTINRLEWGKEYFWRIRYYDANNTLISMSAMHHFSVMPINYQNTEEQRLRVRINDSLKNAGGFLAIDYTRCVFDRSGKPVWTIPTSDTLMDAKIQVRDLRMTDDNTFTFLTGKSPLEIDWDGKILWKAPWPYLKDGDTIIYHHDFQKTATGNYMVMGLKKIYRPMIGNFTDEQLKTADVKQINGKWFQRTQINVMLEFDKKGKLVWFWDSGKHISDEEFNLKKTPNGIPNFATHANAFGISPDQKIIYIGYRDMSRIMKVDKRSGKVLKAYGEKYTGTESKFTEVNFRKQHGAFISSHQSIFLFNNNNIGPLERSVSSVIELNDKDTVTSSVVLWQFDINFDTLTLGKGVSGGNVIECYNSNILVCAGTLNRVFEVTKDKKLVWDAFVETRRKGEKWQAAPQYRTSFKKEFLFTRVYSYLAPTGNENQKELTVYNTGGNNETVLVEFLMKGKCIRQITSPKIMPNSNWTLKLEKEYNSQSVQIQLRSKRSNQVFYPYQVTK